MNKKDVSNEIELKNGKANGRGWSTDEIWHENKRIGEHYCGIITIDHPRYSFEMKIEDERTKRLIIYKYNPITEEEEALDRIENLIS